MIKSDSKKIYEDRSKINKLYFFVSSKAYFSINDVCFFGLIRNYDLWADFHLGLPRMVCR